MDRRLIWSEHVPYARLASGEVLDAFATRNVELVVAVQPAQTDTLTDLLRACRTRDVPVRIWPLLDDQEGRWLSGWTSDAYARHLDAVLKVLSVLKERYEIIFDLEPPIARVRTSLQWFPSAAWLFHSLDHARTHAQLDELISKAREGGHRVSAVVPPFLLWDQDESFGIEKALGISLRGLNFDQVWVMAYTSLLEGYSRGFLRRSDARWLLSNWSRAAAARFGDKAGVALGVVGGGALGDERPYRDESELRDDLAIAQAAGIRHVALFGLAGVLAREPIDTWLAALEEPSLAGPPPQPTRRTRALTELGRSISRFR